MTRVATRKSDAAVVLAGGYSRRMGTSKAWLDFHGTPLLTHVVEQVLEVCSEVVVVATSGQTLPDMPQGVQRLDDPPERAQQGPLAGVITGLEAVDPAASVYLGSTDTVCLTPAHVTFMLECLARSAGSQATVALDEDGRAQPLVSAVRGSTALAAAHSVWASGERRLMSVFEALVCHSVACHELPEVRVVQHCNTRDQWALLRG